MERPVTPPPKAASAQPGILPRSPLTPEQVKRIEINRLKAKAIRDQQEAEFRKQDEGSTTNSAAGQKRAYSAISTSNVPANSRDGAANRAKAGGFRPLDDIQPARNFAKYVEYDMSKMIDTKGGFLTAEDDPHNKALHAPNADEKPAHMTLKEWERHQTLKKLRNQKAGPFEPGLSVLNSEKNKVCRECQSLEIDWTWDDVYKCSICNPCKDKFPEKYSQLTKTEAKTDYLLTDPELKDFELLPYLEKPNPHKATWNNMKLFLRYQVEEYAITKKWGSEEALDEAYEKRESLKKKRKQDKFKSKLNDLKKRTRVEAYRRNRKGEGGGDFGDDLGKGGKHIHVWGRTVENEETGMGIKTCIECSMEVEEMEF